ncbi:hypothetical protein COO60DRAFT_115282 [Scenedesmus sp. NREL 46B-D3]|nr:hypothetical protein COO60DRAFT_115282 [Scenedesmus sp. NREL 46B-D3]
MLAAPTLAASWWLWRCAPALAMQRRQLHAGRRSWRMPSSSGVPRAQAAAAAAAAGTASSCSTATAPCQQQQQPRVLLRQCLRWTACCRWRTLLPAWPGWTLPGCRRCWRWAMRLACWSCTAGPQWPVEHHRLLPSGPQRELHSLNAAGAPAAGDRQPAAAAVKHGGRSSRSSWTNRRKVCDDSSSSGSKVLSRPNPWSNSGQTPVNGWRVPGVQAHNGVLRIDGGPACGALLSHPRQALATHAALAAAAGSSSLPLYHPEVLSLLVGQGKNEAAARVLRCLLALLRRAKGEEVDGNGTATAQAAAGSQHLLLGAAAEAGAAAGEVSSSSGSVAGSSAGAVVPLGALLAAGESGMAASAAVQRCRAFRDAGWQQHWATACPALQQPLLACSRRQR